MIVLIPLWQNALNACLVHDASTNDLFSLLPRAQQDSSHPCRTKQSRIRCNHWQYSTCCDSTRLINALAWHDNRPPARLTCCKSSHFGSELPRTYIQGVCARYLDGRFFGATSEFAIFKVSFFFLFVDVCHLLARLGRFQCQATRWGCGFLFLAACQKLDQTVAEEQKLSLLLLCLFLENKQRLCLYFLF